MASAGRASVWRAPIPGCGSTASTSTHRQLSARGPMPARWVSLIEVRDAASVGADAPYDLVLAFECIHDMADPVGAMRTMRGLAGERGAVIIMDERVGESFAARNEDTEWLMYGFSVLHCLPASLADSPSAATGTVMRRATLRQYALDAGFRDVTALPIDNYFYAFYRLTL